MSNIIELPGRHGQMETTGRPSKQRNVHDSPRQKKNSSDIKLPVSQLESDVQEAHAQEVE